MDALTKALETGHALFILTSNGMHTQREGRGGSELKKEWANRVEIVRIGSRAVTFSAVKNTERTGNDLILVNCTRPLQEQRKVLLGLSQSPLLTKLGSKFHG